MFATLRALESRRYFRLQNVVDSCRTAADMAFGDLLDHEAHRRQEPLGLLLDLLPVLHRAGRVVGHDLSGLADRDTQRQCPKYSLMSLAIAETRRALSAYSGSFRNMKP